MTATVAIVLTDEEIQFLWLLAADVWPNFEIPSDEARVEVKLIVWRSKFGDFSREDVQNTILASTEKFTPPPQALRDQVILRKNATAGIVAPDFDQAFSFVTRLVSRYGHWDEPAALAAAEDFSPLLSAAIQGVGGWMAVCMDENPSVFRGQFRMVYERVQDRYVRTGEMPALNTGHPEIDKAIADFAKQIGASDPGDFIDPED